MCGIGGELRARGRRPDGQPWRVAVADPLGGPPALVVTLAEASIDITFTGDDWDLEETTLEEATTTQPLQVFIGGEIMVGYDAQLTGPKRYTLKVLREWFGTRAETHANGATAYVLQLGLEKPVTWTADLPEGTASFKEQPYLLAQELGLAPCPGIAVTIQKRAQRPAAPTNLRVFEDGAHPSYTSGEDIVVNWTPTSELRFGFNVAQNLECRADATVLQVLTTGGTMKGELAFAGNTGPVTITNAELVALLGSETDFKARAFDSLAGQWHLPDRLPHPECRGWLPQTPCRRVVVGNQDRFGNVLEDRLPRGCAHCPAGQRQSGRRHRPRKRQHPRQRTGGGAG